VAALIAPALVLLWVAGVAFFHWQRIWILYYALGAVGLALLLVGVVQRFVPRGSGFEAATAYGAHYLANVFGIPTRIFQAAPDTVLVMVISQEIGWTALQVGVECSGLLETAIFVGLLAFYPGWSLKHKAAAIIYGTIATYLANLARMLLIISIMHSMGKDWLLIAHTLVGKFAFFALIIVIYWYVLTLPTIAHLRRQQQAKEAA
jgi:exosortase family protein XrtG